MLKSIAHTMLRYSVRHSSAADRPWAEGMLAELDAISSGRESLLWALGSSWTIFRKGLIAGHYATPRPLPRVVFSLGLALTLFALLSTVATTNILIRYLTHTATADAVVTAASQTSNVGRNGKVTYFTDIELEFTYRNDRRTASVQLFAFDQSTATTQLGLYRVGSTHQVKFSKDSAKYVKVKDSDTTPAFLRTAVFSSYAFLMLSLLICYVGKRRAI